MAVGLGQKDRSAEPSCQHHVMGRMAAALVIVEEGNDMSGTRPRDMPSATEEELALDCRHLGTMLKAGSDAPPINW